MSLMEFFTNYTPKTTLKESETVKGNQGNRQNCATVTATMPAKSSGNRGNQGNHENIVNEVKFESESIREYVEERAAIMEFDGGLSRKEAEQAAAKAIRVYCYRVKDKPISELTVIMPNTELDEAYQKLKLKYGDRLLTVYERPCFTTDNKPNQKNINIQLSSTKGITHDNINHPAKS
ncbi:MAG: hypothetical protein PHD43_00765 [Methylococcales bacterium]|nr:hypothetical protein [Methylococcales bacterium]